MDLRQMCPWLCYLHGHVEAHDRGQTQRVPLLCYWIELVCYKIIIKMKERKRKRKDRVC